MCPFVFRGDDTFVRYFWRVMESFSDDERSKFLKFVWGRTRLPKEGDEGWTRPFKISPKTGGDEKLPIAHTCFFQIELPEYSSEEVMRRRLLTAINYSGGEFLIR